MSVLDLLLDEIKTGVIPSIVDLGGAEALAAASDELVRAPILDILALWAARSKADEIDIIDRILLKGFQHTTHSISFREAAEIVIGSPALISRIEKPFVAVLENRFENRVEGSNPLIASYALEAMFHLSLQGTITRHDSLSLMADISDEENELFASHATKLVGAAYHAWGESDLKITLELISQIKDAEEEAVFELGLVFLSLALQAKDQSKIISLLESARFYFDRACVLGEERSDAVAYRAVIDIIRTFAAGGGHEALAKLLNTLELAVARWSTWLDVSEIPDWMRASYDRELNWVQLLRKTHSVASDLQKPSWLKAEAVLSQVLNVYQSDRTFTLGPGLSVLFSPRIEAAFIRERGLLSHLDDLLADPDRLSCKREIARRLRDQISKLERKQSQVQDLVVPDRFPLLASILKEIGHTIELPAGCALNIETALSNCNSQNDLIGKPVTQRILARIGGELAYCDHYVGEVKLDFDTVLQQIVTFSISRLDATRSRLRERGAYLFNKNAMEWDLQSDLHDFIVGNLARADVRTEVTDVGSGRADIYISFGLHRFIIELKKEATDCSRDGLRKYLDQASAYQSSDIRLGFLGVLDLTERNGPPPHVEESIWTEAYVPVGSELPRYVVVFRIAGCLQSPSVYSKR